MVQVGDRQPDHPSVHLLLHEQKVEDVDDAPFDQIHQDREGFAGQLAAGKLHHQIVDGSNANVSHANPRTAGPSAGRQPHRGTTAATALNDQPTACPASQYAKQQRRIRDPSVGNVPRMDLKFIQGLYDGPHRFTSVYIDATHDTEPARSAIKIRWKNLRASLSEQGAD